MVLNEATLLAGMELSKLSSTWGIYKGDVERRDGEIVSVYLKPALPPRFAFKEFFAVFLARLFGVSTPEPCLVFIPEHYNVLVNKQDVSGTYCFAMEIKQYPDMSRNFSGDFFNDEKFSEDFLKNKDVAIMGIFDEILYNQDRHHENILFDGENVYLIDHENILDRKDATLELGYKNWMWCIAGNSNELSFKRVERKVFGLIKKQCYEGVPDHMYKSFWKKLVFIHNKLNTGSKCLLKTDALTYCRRSRNIWSLTKRSRDRHKSGQLGFQYEK